MSKKIPSWFAAISVLCTLGCGGSPTTRVTPAASVTPTATPRGALAWAVEVSGTTAPVTAIWGRAADDVWAVANGRVLRSRGDGRWAVAYDDAHGDLYATVFGDATQLFVAGSACDGGICQGGVLLRSLDGGATFTRQTLPNAALAGAVADGKAYLAAWDVYASGDGFATMDVLHPSFPVAEAVDAGDGALLAFGGTRSGVIGRSVDGGATWTTVFEGVAGSKSGHIGHVARAGATRFAVGEACTVPDCAGALLRSDDGGATWRVANGDVMPNAHGVWAAAADDVWVAGTTLAHSDHGAQFGTVALPTSAALYAVWGSSADDVYVAGAGGVIVHGRR